MRDSFSKTNERKLENLTRGRFRGPTTSPLKMCCLANTPYFAPGTMLCPMVMSLGRDSSMGSGSREMRVNGNLN